jgi:hypothetical protein
MPTATDNHVCFEQISFAAVTPKGFSDVSILTQGEALGHGVLVDERTIEQFTALALGKTIPAYLTHEDALGDRLGGECGMFSGFYREGDRVRARNFVFLQSFVDNENEEHSTLVELAQKYPDQLGISPVMRVARAWVLNDGSEVPADGMRPDNAVSDMPALRVLGIVSCDFVKTPAANTALFSAKVDQTDSKQPDSMATQTIELAKHTEAVAAKDAEIATLSAQHKDAVAALETKHAEAVAAFEAKLAESVKTLAESVKALEAVAAEKSELTKALDAEKAARAEAEQYDIRKAGGEAIAARFSEIQKAQLPEPAKNDAGKWAQYAELEAKDKPAAAEFYAKYLSRSKRK